MGEMHVPPLHKMRPTNSSTLNTFHDRGCNALRRPRCGEASEHTLFKIADTKGDLQDGEVRTGSGLRDPKTDDSLREPALQETLMALTTQRPRRAGRGRRASGARFSAMMVLTWLKKASIKASTDFVGRGGSDLRRARAGRAHKRRFTIPVSLRPIADAADTRQLSSRCPMHKDTFTRMSSAPRPTNINLRVI